MVTRFLRKKMERIKGKRIISRLKGGSYMSVYYMVIGVISCLAIFGNLAKRNTNFNAEGVLCDSEKTAAFLMVWILVLVAGLRYRVGTDYIAYYQNYEAYKLEKLSLIDEPGIRIIARASSMIYDRPETMIFIAAAITVAITTICIIKRSDIYWLSILLYVFTGTWHGCFNGVRQYLAASILFMGAYAIKEGKFLKWCLFVTIASMFHITSVIAIFFYFFGRQRISWKQVPICLFIIIAGVMGYDRIFEMIGFLQNSEVNTTYSYITNSINPLRIAVTWVPILFVLFFYSYFDKEDEKFRFYFNMTLLNAVLMTVASQSTYLGRIGIYTNVYTTIIWPLLVKKCNVRSQKVLIAMMLFMYFLYWHTEASGFYLNSFQWIFSHA